MDTRQFFVVRHKTEDRFFVGTGGAYGGSTASRGKKIPPKLYANHGRAQAALKASIGAWRPEKMAEWEICAAEVNIADPA